jgi:hypothetical protein
MGDLLAWQHTVEFSLRQDGGGSTDQDLISSVSSRGPSGCAAVASS